MTNEKRESFVNLSSVKAKEIEWFWEPLIPFGMITIMEGDPGIGKSFLAMHLAAVVSVGGELPGGQVVEKGRALYLSAEDDPAYTIRPRIDEMGGNAKRIRIQGDFLSLNEEGLKALANEVRRYPPDLMIIDPLFAYVPSGQDMYRPNVMRPLLSFLREIAEQGETAILIVRHLTKAKHDKAIYQGGGSMDVIGAARSAFLVTEDPQDENIKLVAHIKHNIVPRGPTWTYELVAKNNSGNAILEWKGSSDLTIDDLMGNLSQARKSELDSAVDFLRSALKDGPEPSKSVSAKAHSLGISKRTLDRARKKIAVVSDKGKKRWILRLPDEKT